MPVKRFAPSDGEQPRLEISWQGHWANLVARFDGVVVVELVDHQPLAGTGHTVALPDGRTLTLATTSKTGVRTLEVLIDGRPVPGSSTHPQKKLNLVVGYFGVRSAWAALDAVASRNSEVDRTVLAAVAVFFVLGYGVPALLLHRRVRLAGAVAGVIVLLEATVEVAGLVIMKGPANMGPLLWLFVGLFLLRLGDKAICELRELGPSVLRAEGPAAGVPAAVPAAISPRPEIGRDDS